MTTSVDAANAVICLSERDWCAKAHLGGVLDEQQQGARSRAGHGRGMPQGIDHIFGPQRRTDNGNVNCGERNWRHGMIDHFRENGLVAAWNAIPAALVGIRCWRTLAFETTIRSLTVRRACCEAIERPD